MSLDDRRIPATCNVCSSPKVHYRFSLGEFRIEECSNCRLMRLAPQPNDETLAGIYNADYFIGGDESSQTHVRELKSATAHEYLRLLREYVGHPLSGTLLEVGCGHGDLLLQAASLGLKVTGIEYAPRAAATAAERLGSSGEVITGEISSLAGSGRRFDFVVFADVLEHVRDPRAFLRHVHELLEPNGIAVAICPSTDSLSARLMGASWMEFKLEHLWYYSKANISRLMYDESFGALRIFPARKTLSADYITEHFIRYPVRPITGFLRTLRGLLPSALRRYPVKVTASGIVVIAKRLEKRQPRMLSIIMPAYNEAATVRGAIERVLAKSIDSLATELIIVESNSTDGTRDVVNSFADRSCVRVILQDRPRGKGNAVREGLQNARGDFILIQDADDEYDIEDYDALLEPLISGEAAFVLGARHGGGSWKMREFTGKPITSMMFNFGHWFFASLINLVYWQNMKDPFTMYKVFRADCLDGLTFRCDRFDFDHELVIKMVRKGYVPVEIPVNYRSRSFAEGKKVDSLRDPLTWLATIIRLRFEKI